MKNLVKYILFFSVAALYLFSTMGYGVHKCTEEGTASVILLYGETPCEYAHSHMDEHGHSFTHSHAPCEHHGEECDHSHSEDCCSTNVYVLSQDQNTAEYNMTIAPQICDAFIFMADMQEVVSSLAAVSYKTSGYTSRDCVPQVPQAVLCSFRV